jgi:hypothetical protein
MTGHPNGEVDQTPQDVFEGSTPAEADAQRRRDLAASLTAALFGSLSDATETDAEEMSDE